MKKTYNTNTYTLLILVQNVKLIRKKQNFNIKTLVKFECWIVKEWIYVCICQLYDIIIYHIENKKIIQFQSFLKWTSTDKNIYWIYAKCIKIQNILIQILHFWVNKQRGSRERTSLSKEAYTVKHPLKIFPSCDDNSGVDTCVGSSGWMVLKNLAQTIYPINPTSMSSLQLLYGK